MDLPICEPDAITLVDIATVNRERAMKLWAAFLYSQAPTWAWDAILNPRQYSAQQFCAIMADYRSADYKAAKEMPAEQAASEASIREQLGLDLDIQDPTVIVVPGSFLSYFVFSVAAIILWFLLAFAGHLLWAGG